MINYTISLAGGKTAPAQLTVCTDSYYSPLAPVSPLPLLWGGRWKALPAARPVLYFPPADLRHLS